MSSIMNEKRKVSDMVIKVLINMAAGISVLLLVGILAYVFVKGIGSVNWRFLTTVTSTLNNTVGIAGNIVNTLYIIVITLLIATPVGIGSAIYLNEYAKPGRLVRAIEFTTETLSGIPSIIFGLFGMVFFGNALGLGYSILTGSLTLTLMVLPLITRNTQEALKTVPDSYRSGALGMGATKWYMIRTVVLPSAVDGIVTGCILAVGRIVGESAALLFTAGMANEVIGFFEAFEPGKAGSTLTVSMYMYAKERGDFDTAFAISVILLMLTLIINLTAKFTAVKLKKGDK